MNDNKLKLFIVFLVMLITACDVSIKPGYIEDDKKAGEEAVNIFHKRYSQRQFNDIYANIHKLLKEKASEHDVIASLDSNYNNYGKVILVTDKWINVIVGAPVQVRAIYNTKCDKGNVTESFIFIREGEEYKLFNYNIWPGTIKPENRKQ